MAGAPTCAVLTGCRDLVFSVNASSYSTSPGKMTRPASVWTAG